MLPKGMTFRFRLNNGFGGSVKFLAVMDVIVFQETMSTGNVIETDACVVQLNYKTTMIDINNQLGQRDIASMKFLLSDFISVSRIERIRTGLDIIQALQQMRLISEPDNILFLGELLLLIGRIDLLCKLNISQDDVKSSLSNMQSQLKHVLPYRYAVL